MLKFEINTDREYILHLLTMYTVPGDTVLESQILKLITNKDLRTSLDTIKLDIKNLQAIDPIKYESLIQKKLKDLLSIESYIILNKGITKL